MVSIEVVTGDITAQAVDAVVNAANNGMRGGGGVDGAIHRVGGPAVLADCIARFPRGLATGDAGWTIAGDLPARWVIHAVAPNRRRGHTDVAVLRSAYRRSLEVAEDLDARSVAFPLLGAGVYGWWPRSSANAAVTEICAHDGALERVVLVAFDDDAARVIEDALLRRACLRILEAVAELHRRGYQQIRISPGLAPSGLHWRLTIEADGATLGHSSANRDFLGAPLSPTEPLPTLADRILAALPPLRPTADPAYATWLTGLLTLAATENEPPISFRDAPIGPDWQVGAALYPQPPSGE